MKITSSSIDDFMADFRNALVELERKHDVRLSYGGIRYNDNQFHTKLTVKNNTVDGVDVAVVEFNKLAGRYGFESDDLNREFVMNGERFKLTGFNPKARKNVCNIHRLDNGKDYVCSVLSVKNGFIYDALKK